MAGVKGKSGGARPGAGRKKNAENKGEEFGPSTAGLTPVEVLELFMHDPSVPLALRLKAAQAAAPFRHKKLGEGGKKEAKEEAAKNAGQGRYAARTGPRAQTH